MTESGLQRRIRTALEREFKGSFWFKVHGNAYTPVGMPDLLGCVEGYYCAIEIKVPGEVPDPIQHERMQEIANAGGCVGWADNVEEAIELIQQFISEKQRGR